ncbi:MAG: GTPase ObgE [Clostridiales bacterium]|uniref:GTPase Obg n=1 Tax=Congzhengia minquanensis TaxID=2763657 RepID=A0A926HWV1_9FIRM|nr:GTPase ObgE [Congzhengia minquanensis]MBC8539389.1 GTPase ObgE [Congzhengia minquanensis]MBD8946424.1 GTPase ObgE [Clostridiales bacterium]
MFADIATITVKAGNGGNGLVSFHREKYVAAGGPDGGDGGNGGDVVLVADAQLSTLTDFRYKKIYKAGNGQDGRAKKSSGKNGENILISVPAGTLVKDAESGKIIADLKKSGDRFIAAKGGRGGWGNVHFATPTRQVPKFAKPGQKTVERTLTLELKLLADVGLVGFPNVGKSTLLSAVSSARPKIANYHFTTLEPNLGVVTAGEAGSFVMADIPGIIEGANTGIGLGHEFLRHIERTRILLHIVDISGTEGRNPVEDFDIICEEMEKFNPALAQKPQIAVGNKMDVLYDDSLQKEFENAMKERGIEVFFISAAAHKGTQELMKTVASKLKEIPIPEFDVEEDDFESVKMAGKDFDISVQNNVYSVQGDVILKIIESTNFDDYESLQFFQNALRTNGIIAALVEAGIEEGDTVKLYDIEFEFVN